MKPAISFFPVGNGDMALIKLGDKTTILTDINLCDSCDDEKNVFDAATALRDKLETDNQDRPYVDVFLLSHPDQDHCRGLKTRFHLGPLSNYVHEPPEGEQLKIIMREIWSSPIIFRRASKNHTLCEDAKAFNTEAKRRIKAFRDNGACPENERILIIGEDEEGKTEGLESILIKNDEVFNTVNGKVNDDISMRMLAPIPVQDDAQEEERLEKNHSSVILQFSFTVDGEKDACFFLSGGDAGVYIWEKIWERKKNQITDIQYDLLLAPHHCSWHSLSHDSWSKDENPKISPDAKSALSQAGDGACIVSSSKPILNDKNDPPCWGAKQEYLTIINSVNGQFFCTGEHPDQEAPNTLTFTISSEGVQPPAKKNNPAVGAAIGIKSAREPLRHG